MARPVCWNESFDAADLGVVTEAEVLGSGFGGVVCAGRVGEHQIASKELYRDDEDEELFKEVYVGLLVPASPCMGFAQTREGAPRLISARLSETVAEFLARAVWPFDVCVQLAIGMLEAVEQVTHLGLVHCDIKPSNFMLDEKLNVYIILYHRFWCCDSGRWSAAYVLPALNSSRSDSHSILGRVFNGQGFIGDLC